jgi:hypothetical protein
VPCSPKAPSQPCWDVCLWLVVTRQLSQVQKEFNAEMEKLATWQGMIENDLACSYFKRSVHSTACMLHPPEG